MYNPKSTVFIQTMQEIVAHDDEISTVRQAYKVTCRRHRMLGDAFNTAVHIHMSDIRYRETHSKFWHETSVGKYARTHRCTLSYIRGNIRAHYRRTGYGDFIRSIDQK